MQLALRTNPSSGQATTSFLLRLGSLPATQGQRSDDEKSLAGARKQRSVAFVKVLHEALDSAHE